MDEEICKVCNEKVDVYYDEDEKICEYCHYKQEKAVTVNRFNELLSNDNRSELDDLAFELHTESNCNCNADVSTYTLVSEGAGDIEMCLNCYGARGCVY